jgi:hypothetical protein
MSFSRNLCCTIMIAILGALVLAVTSSLEPGGGGELRGALPPGSAEAAEAFRRAFLAAAAALAVSFIAVAMIERRPLRTDNPALERRP